MIRNTSPKGYRLVETRRGDTPQSVAARELGDASRWTEIVSLNDLASPYMVDSIAALEGTPAGRVALAGQAIKVPAPQRRASAVADADIYGTDMRLGPDGDLPVDEETGDWAVVSGPKNLTQAIRNRIATDPGELQWHPTYGCGVRRLVGKGNGPPRGMLAAAIVSRAVQTDPRISKVVDMEADVSGDALRVSGVAVASDGKKLPVAIGDEGE